MLYLLDANVLIDANRDYYPIERVPEFWEWLEYHGSANSVKIPLEVHEEVKEGSDSLGSWARQDSTVHALVLDDEADPTIVSRVVNDGYAPDLSDDEIIKIGRDPFLIAYALIDVGNRYVVTTETSKPCRRRANRHIPDVCSTLGVQCMNTFQFLRALDFSTRWIRP